MATFLPFSQAEAASATAKNGSVTYDEGLGEGKHIFFDLNETTGLISDYGINTSDGRKVLIDNVSLEGFVPSELEFLGSLVKMSDDNSSLTMHDNPTGLMHAKMKKITNINLELAGNLTVIEQMESDGEEEVAYQLIVSDNVTRGVIISDRPFEIFDNDTVIETECKDLLIRFLPQVDPERGWVEEVLMDAVEDGRISAEVFLAINEEGAGSDIVPYDTNIQVEVLSVKQNRFQIGTGMENPDGMLLLVHVEKDIVEMVEGRLQVELEGTDLQPVQNFMVLIYEHPEEPSYAVIDDGDANQMLIYLPSTTLGEVTVEGIGPWAALLTPAGIIVTVGSIALVLIAGFMAFRKR
ncbi:MAG: hypothetical protein AB9860_01285 [Methanomassiliicoccales archaeon]